MRHHALSAAISIGLAAVFLTLNAGSASANPYGYWRKADQGERPAKMQIHRCGSGGRYLCVKIAWLKNPLDRKGNPLRDIRNSNPSQRGREIKGLPIVKGMAKVGANQWKGNIYNPEDGNTYSATLTLVSRNKIVLKGCKAFLLCGERVWLRTSPPPKPEPQVKPEEQIEASAKPEAAPVAAAEGAPKAAATAIATTTAKPEANTLGDAEMITPAAQQSEQPGYRFLNSAAAAQGHAGFTGENVSSMFVMTKPIEGAAPAANAAVSGTAAVAAAEGAAVPAEPKPAAQPTPAPKPVAEPAPVQEAAPKSAPAPVAPAAAEGEVAPAAPSETAVATEAAPPRKLTRRERRRLRRQQKGEVQGLLPWLR